MTDDMGDRWRVVYDGAVSGVCQGFYASEREAEEVAARCRVRWATSWPAAAGSVRVEPPTELAARVAEEARLAPPDACPSCGVEAIQECSDRATWQRVTLGLDGVGKLGVTGWASFDYGDGVRVTHYLCRNCASEWPSLLWLRRAQLAAGAERQMSWARTALDDPGAVPGEEWERLGPGRVIASIGMPGTRSRMDYAVARVDDAMMLLRRARGDES